MKKIKLNNYQKKIFADTITPVEVYLKIRDIYPNSLLLENSDYMLANNNYSFICFNQIVYIKKEPSFKDGSFLNIIKF